MLALLRYLDARMGEDATYASIAAMLALLGVHLDPGVWHNVSVVGAMFAGVLGVVLKSAGNKPPSQVAADVLAELVARITPPAQPGAGGSAPK